MTGTKAAFRHDPITVEVLSNALSGIAEEIGEAVIRAAYSDNIKERRDTTVALFDASGRTIAQAAHIPIHLGSILGVVEVLRQYRPHEIRDGDIFISNDPYTAGGTHLNDIVATAPVFVDGQLRGFVANLGHHADFFDRGPRRHIWQEGLRIPAMKIVERGAVNRDLLDLILLNCQLPNDRIGDLRAQFAGCWLGVARFRELCERFTADVVLGAADDLIDHTERLARQQLKELVPDGEYAFDDALDSPYLDEPVSLSILIRSSAGHLTIDFPNVPPQGPHPLNMNETAMLATCYYALKTMLDPSIPANAGLHRVLTINAPRGSLLNCAEPAAVDSRTNTCQRVVDLIHGALASVMPDRITAAHNGSNTEVAFRSQGGDATFRYSESAGGGLGARATKDGIDGAQCHVTNTTNLPIEVLETTYPMRVVRYELAQDSGGPGKWRGGMGFVRELTATREAIVGGADVTRAVVPPWGLFGGLSGGTQKVEIRREDGKVENPPLSVDGYLNVVLQPGETLRLTTSGGGGYGRPAERDGWRVAADLREGRISRNAARRSYGTGTFSDDSESSAVAER